MYHLKESAAKQMAEHLFRSVSCYVKKGEKSLMFPGILPHIVEKGQNMGRYRKLIYIKFRLNEIALQSYSLYNIEKELCQKNCSKYKIRLR